MTKKIFFISLLVFTASLSVRADSGNKPAVQDQLTSAIAKLKIDDIIFCLSDKKLDKDKKKQALVQALVQVEKRKLVASSLLKSPRDLLALGKGSMQLITGLLCFIIGNILPHVMSHKKSMGAVTDICLDQDAASGVSAEKKKAEQLAVDIKNGLPTLGYAASGISYAVSGFLLYKSIQNIKNSLSCRNGQAQLKRAQAIETYIRQISAL